LTLLASDLTTAVDVLIGLALVGAMLYFLFLLTVAAAHRRVAPPGPHCEQCDAALIPLLDASRAYHGEAACSRCGTLHEGVPWPTDGAWYVDMGARKPTPEAPARKRGGAHT
jgi:hypothetical protein